jgi:hypothetical protein
MEHAREFSAHVLRHLSVVGPKAASEVTVTFSDGTEVRGKVTHASPVAVMVNDEHTRREVSIHFARVKRAEVVHIDGTVVVFS